MLTTEDSIAIDRPIDEVFAFVSDVSNDPLWNPAMVGAKRTSAGAIGPGATFDVQFKPFLGASTCTMRVAAYEQGRRYEVTGSPGPMKAHAVFLFEPLGAGTQVTRRTQLRVTGPMRLLEPLMHRPLRKQSAAMLTSLKSYLERSAAP